MHREVALLAGVKMAFKKITLSFVTVACLFLIQATADASTKESAPDTACQGNDPIIPVLYYSGRKSCTGTVVSWDSDDFLALKSLAQDLQAKEDQRIRDKQKE